MKNSVIMKFRCIGFGDILVPGKIPTQQKHVLLAPLDGPEFHSVCTKSAIRLFLPTALQEQKDAAALFEYGQEYSVEVARIQKGGNA